MSSDTPGNAANSISSNTPNNTNRISITIARDAWNSFIYDDLQRAQRLAPQALAQPQLPDVLKALMQTIMATPSRDEKYSRSLGSDIPRCWRRSMLKRRLLELARETHSVSNERSIPKHETYSATDPFALLEVNLDQRALTKFSLEDACSSESDDDEEDSDDETEDELVVSSSHGQSLRSRLYALLAK